MLSSDDPMSLRSAARSVIQPLSSSTSSVTCSERESTVCQGRVEVVDHLADQLVAVGQGRGQRRRLLQQALDRAALALQHLDQVHAQLVDLLGLQRLEERLEAVEERGEVERGAGLLDRDGVAVLQPLRLDVRALLEREVAVADEVEEPDLRARGRGQRHVGLDPERHQRVVALVVLDLLDLADADPGDPDVVALLEHRRGGEDRLVLLAGAEADVAHDRREQSGDQERDDGEDAELDAGGPGLGLASATQRGGAHELRLLCGLGGGLVSGRRLLAHGPSPPRTTGP